MKLLLIKQNFHFKNLNALLKYNIDIEIYDNNKQYDFSQYDVIYSPEYPIDVSKYPNHKFIFGPHFSVFPIKDQMQLIEGPNSVYVQPSEWTKQAWCNNNNKFYVLPFGVDTYKFCEIKPLSMRNEVIVYYKHRNPAELQALQHFLQSKNIQYTIFSYMHKYTEDDYLKYLQNAKYMILLDAHESQGFAVEEAMSCNVPLLVWNVKSMNQEYGSNYPDIPATSIPYWDSKCGEYFYNYEDINTTYNIFIENLEKYKPREYVLDNLSISVCEQKMLDLINLI